MTEGSFYRCVLAIVLFKRPLQRELFPFRINVAISTSSKYHRNALVFIINDIYILFFFHFSRLTRNERLFLEEYSYDRFSCKFSRQTRSLGNSELTRRAGQRNPKAKQSGRRNDPGVI